MDKGVPSSRLVIFLHLENGRTILPPTDGGDIVIAQFASNKNIL